MADTNKTTRRRVRGFTLIELLVVMVILAIVIALAVAIGGYINEESGRKRTQAAMAVLKTAISEYQDANDGLAPEDDWNPAWGTKPDEGASSVALLKQLKKVPESWQIVQQLEEEIFEDDDTALKDGFGYNLKYDKDAGRGGTPVLVSPGPDGDLDETDDNIRSDLQ
jgi:prepilin-type N-terminal cleavage/methylation domain-containing protein